MDWDELADDEGAEDAGEDDWEPAEEEALEGEEDAADDWIELGVVEVVVPKERLPRVRVMEGIIVGVVADKTPAVGTVVVGTTVPVAWYTAVDGTTVPVA